MKLLILGLLSSLIATHMASAAPRPVHRTIDRAINLTKVKSIACTAVAYWEEDAPQQKTMPSGLDFKIFTAGSRADVKPAPGAFLLSEYSLDPGGHLNDLGNQQYYFKVEPNGTLTFSFLADWKASGKLKINDDGSATGFINQKSHITALTCLVKS